MERTIIRFFGWIMNEISIMPLRQDSKRYELVRMVLALQEHWNDNITVRYEGEVPVQPLTSLANRVICQNPLLTKSASTCHFSLVVSDIAECQSVFHAFL